MSTTTRPRQGVSSTTESAARTTDTRTRCPECGRDVRTVDVQRAECPDCDIVVDATPVSREARPVYNEEDRLSRARCGGRRTMLRSDRGTGVGMPTNATTDANGNQLPSAKARLFSDAPWKKPRTSEEYRLDYAFGEIKRMGDALDIPRPDREDAGQLFRRCHDRGLVAGRSLEGFVTVCLLAAARTEPQPIPVLRSELCRVSRATDDEFAAARGAILRELDGISVPWLEPIDLVPRVASDLDTPGRVKRVARDLVRAYQETDHGRSLSPRTVAGAAFHAAYDLVDIDDRPSLTVVASAVDIAGSTISSRKKVVLECHEEVL